MLIFYRMKSGAVNFENFRNFLARLKLYYFEKIQYSRMQVYLHIKPEKRF